ncbi:MAG: DUF490 domain-containing protein, partial [Polaromonas sp.]
MDAPATVEPRRRWPRALAASALAVLLVLLLALASVWWWSGSEGSLATALRWASRSQPVTAEGVSGSLRAGGQVQLLSLQQDGLQVLATDVVLAWDPLSLLKGSLKLDRLAAAQVRIDDQRAAAPRAAGPPASLALPFRITLDEFSVGQLLWLGPPSFDASNITGRYDFDGTHHRLDLHGARVATGTYSGRVSLLATGEQKLDAVLQGVLDTAVPGRNTRLPLSFNATAQGPLKELIAKAELQISTPSPRAAGTPQASATARITPWAAQPLPQADATFRALDLASLWPAAPHTGLSGNVNIKPVGETAKTWQLQTEVKNSLPGPWDQQRLPLDSLQAEGEWRDGVAMLRSLQAQLGGGQITASGQWSEAAPSATGAQDWKAEALLKNINPAALHTEFAALPVDGRAELAGNAGAIHFDASLKASEAKVATRSSSTVGSLRLRDATATGRWAGDTLTLTGLQVRSDDATLTGAVEVQPAARSGKGRLNLNAPGLEAQLKGELRETRGGGELSLRGRDAAQALRWLQRLPGMPAALRTASASGRADLQLAWQGGWRDPAVQAQL